MKTGCFFFLFITSILITTTVEGSEPQRDSMGGWTKISTEPKIFFYARHIDGIWWFINPGGNVFISKGVNRLSFTGEHAPALGYSPYWRQTMRKYQQAYKWADAVVGNLQRWNFNTIGVNSTPSLYHKKMPYTVMLNFCSAAGGSKQGGFLPDVFSSDFERAVNLTAKNKCAERQQDIYLLGYFLDEELYWAADENSPTSMLINYLFLPKTSAGAKRAYSFLQERYEDTDTFNQAWKLNLKSMDELTTIRSFQPSNARKQDEADFLELYAQQYFQVCYDAIKEADPNHLIFSSHLSGKVPEPVLKAMKGIVDVVCYNNYDHTPPLDELFRIFEITRLPILLTEFSFKADDAKLANQNGRGKAVATQQDRADLFSSYITDLMSMPFMIGYHWVEYTDQPAEGRFDGANNNYGLVNIKDEPWETLTAQITLTNEKIERIHAGMR